jgi:hypothetical protein
MSTEESILADNESRVTAFLTDLAAVFEDHGMYLDDGKIHSQHEVLAKEVEVIEDEFSFKTRLGRKRFQLNGGCWDEA